jgi:hypothetical protein
MINALWIITLTVYFGVVLAADSSPLLKENNVSSPYDQTILTFWNETKLDVPDMILLNVSSVDKLNLGNTLDPNTSSLSMDNVSNESSTILLKNEHVIFTHFDASEEHGSLLSILNASALIGIIQEDSSVEDSEVLEKKENNITIESFTTFTRLDNKSGEDIGLSIIDSPSKINQSESIMVPIAESTTFQVFGHSVIDADDRIGSNESAIEISDLGNGTMMAPLTPLLQSNDVLTESTAVEIKPEKSDLLSNSLLFDSIDNSADLPDFAVPTLNPTAMPVVPTKLPSKKPSTKPTRLPTARPVVVPTKLPTRKPNVKLPSHKPSAKLPTGQPSNAPSPVPTLNPTAMPVVPTKLPSKKPSTKPTRLPTARPVVAPTKLPTRKPSSRLPISRPSIPPSAVPTLNPTAMPVVPTKLPSKKSSIKPTRLPTTRPIAVPTKKPTQYYFPNN